MVVVIVELNWSKREWTAMALVEFAEFAVLYLAFG